MAQASQERQTSESPVPSFTLQITKDDAERFMQASQALESSLEKMMRQTPQHPAGDAAASTDTQGNGAHAPDSSTSLSSKPLHEKLYQAAKQCDHPLLRSLFEREASFKMPVLEAQLAFLLFHNSDKTAKLQRFFSALSSSNSSSQPESQQQQQQKPLNRTGLLSLFRSVLFALSCCVHTPGNSTGSNKTVVVEGKPETSPSDRPTKRIKTEDDPSDPPEIQSASFDSSLATLRDEEDGKENSAAGGGFGSLRREIEDIAAFAADEIMTHAKAKDSTSTAVDLASFGEWYKKSGRTIVPWVELLELSKWQQMVRPKEAPKEREEKAPPVEKKAVKEEFSTAPAPSPPKEAASGSPASLLTESDPDSRAVLSFDFSDPANPTRVVVHITEDNILALRHMVQRTGLINRPAPEVCKILFQLSPHRKAIDRHTFRNEMFRLMTREAYDNLSATEREAFQEALLEYFGAFEGSSPSLHETEVDLRELAMGFCLFCAGNKSHKLALGFELLDSARCNYLTETQLLRYLQSYLSMLVATSLMVPIPKRKGHRPITPQRRSLMHAAVHRGAKWTLRHFVEAEGATSNGHYTFDAFANWYSVSGYNIAPWLELLDLNKVFPLVTESVSPLRLPTLNQDVHRTAPRRVPRDRVSSLRRHHSSRRRGPPPEILFTFPLANRRSLVVLRDDAVYVRDVVEQLGLLSVRPETLWDALSSTVKKRRKNKPKRPQQQNTPEYVDMSTFVECVQEVCPKLSRKRAYPGGSAAVLSSTVEELLSNFFQCFDLNQTDRVAIDELMGGLSLLCGGKKSTKLAFAFSIFDTRPGVQNTKPKKNDRIVHSLSGEDLFLFLRSILIVTFSCCRQSLDMSDEQVGRCIADTANMICNDVMRYQWEMKQVDRLDFDEFGQWYNDGGFERAPWLELLDLKKWVLVDNYDTLEKKVAATKSTHHVQPPPPPMRPLVDDHPGAAGVPPPPPEDALDTSFFDENAIMPMDSIDEMDMILMQPSMDKDTDIASPKLSKSFSFPTSPERRPEKSSGGGNALKFHLMTSDKHGGYMLSVSHARITHLRRIILQSGVNSLDAETVCNHIISKASRGKITRQSFDSAMEKMIPSLANNKSSPDMKVLANVLSTIFSSFDPDNSGKARAIEVACGFTVLCRGKKSDKLEFAFEVLDKNKRGQLSRSDITSYLQSFLTVLLSIAVAPALDRDDAEDSLSTLKGGACDNSTKTLVRAVRSGADWAAGLAFSNLSQGSNASSMTFDDFAAWYTSAGYSSIPWLELLDLQKWVLAG